MMGHWGKLGIFSVALVLMAEQAHAQARIAAPLPPSEFDASSMVSRAASDAVTQVELINNGIGLDESMRAEVCHFGMESYVTARADRGDPTATFTPARGRAECSPEGFANFVCSASSYRFAQATGQRSYSHGFRQTVYDDLSIDISREGCRDVSALSEAQRAECRYDCSAPRTSGRAHMYCNLQAGNYDPNSDQCQSGSPACRITRMEFRSYAMRMAGDPLFQQRMQAGSVQRGRMQQARNILSTMRAHMRAAVWNAFCGQNQPVTEITSESFLGDNACVTASSTTGVEPRVFIERIFRSLDRAEIATPTGNACIGDDNNVSVIRRTDGSPIIYMCPRALAQLGSGSVGELAVRAQLARALGHALDSCALEMMSVDFNGQQRSLATLSDGLRGCLVENTLREPPLSARPARGATAARYSPEWLGRELSSQSERDLVLGVSAAADGAPRRSHCSAARAAVGGTPLGSTEEERQINPANALEAQYWATQALDLSLRADSTGWNTQSRDVEGWRNFCATQPTADQAACNGVLPSSAAAQRMFRIKMMFQPLCAGLADAGVEGQSRATARSVFAVIDQNPELRRALGCTRRNEALPVVSNLTVPSPAQVRGAAHPNYGTCGPTLLSEQLTALMNSPGARPTRRMRELPTTPPAATTATALAEAEATASEQAAEQAGEPQPETTGSESTEVAASPEPASETEMRSRIVAQAYASQSSGQGVPVRAGAEQAYPAGEIVIDGEAQPMEVLVPEHCRGGAGVCTMGELYVRPRGNAGATPRLIGEMGSPLFQVPPGSAAHARLIELLEAQERPVAGAAMTQPSAPAEAEEAQAAPVAAPAAEVASEQTGEGESAAAAPAQALAQEAAPAAEPAQAPVQEAAPAAPEQPAAAPAQAPAAPEQAAAPAEPEAQRYIRGMIATAQRQDGERVILPHGEGEGLPSAMVVITGGRLDNQNLEILVPERCRAGGASCGVADLYVHEPGVIGSVRRLRDTGATAITVDEPETVRELNRAGGGRLRAPATVTIPITAPQAPAAPAEAAAPAAATAAAAAAAPTRMSPSHCPDEAPPRPVDWAVDRERSGTRTGSAEWTPGNGCHYTCTRQSVQDTWTCRIR